MVTTPDLAVPNGGWTPTELKRIGEADELVIAAERADGTLGHWTPIWAVCAEGHVFVRTWNQRTTGWYGQVLRSQQARIRVADLETDVSIDDIGANPAALRDSIDTAYRSKYGALGSRSMVTTTSAATTLQLLSPHGGTSWDQIDHAPDYILKSIKFHIQRTWVMVCAVVTLLTVAAAALL